MSVFDPDQVLSFYADWIAFLREKKVELLAQAAKLDKALAKKKGEAEEAPSPAWSGDGDDDLPPIAAPTETQAQPASKSDSFLDIAFGGQADDLPPDEPAPTGGGQGGSTAIPAPTGMPEPVAFEAVIAPVIPEPPSLPAAPEPAPQSAVPAAPPAEATIAPVIPEPVVEAEPTPLPVVPEPAQQPSQAAPGPVKITIKPRPAPKAPPVEEEENLA